VDWHKPVQSSLTLGIAICPSIVCLIQSVYHYVGENAIYALAALGRLVTENMMNASKRITFWDMKMRCTLSPSGHIEKVEHRGHVLKQPAISAIALADKRCAFAFVRHNDILTIVPKFLLTLKHDDLWVNTKQNAVKLGSACKFDGGNTAKLAELILKVLIKYVTGTENIASIATITGVFFTMLDNKAYNHDVADDLCTLAQSIVSIEAGGALDVHQQRFDDYQKNEKYINYSKKFCSQLEFVLLASYSLDYVGEYLRGCDDKRRIAGILSCTSFVAPKRGKVESTVRLASGTVIKARRLEECDVRYAVLCSSQKISEPSIKEFLDATDLYVFAVPKSEVQRGLVTTIAAGKRKREGKSPDPKSAKQSLKHRTISVRTYVNLRNKPDVEDGEKSADSEDDESSDDADKTEITC
jgi:hypothetical protein